MVAGGATGVAATGTLADVSTGWIAVERFVVAFVFGTGRAFADGSLEASSAARTAAIEGSGNSAVADGDAPGTSGAASGVGMTSRAGACGCDVAATSRRSGTCGRGPVAQAQSSNSTDTVENLVVRMRFPLDSARWRNGPGRLNLIYADRSDPDAGDMVRPGSLRANGQVLDCRGRAVSAGKFDRGTARCESSRRPLPALAVARFSGRRARGTHLVGGHPQMQEPAPPIGWRRPVCSSRMRSGKFQRRGSVHALMMSVAYWTW